MPTVISQNIFFSLQYSWFFFEVLIKSMAQYLIENSKVKVCQFVEKKKSHSNGNLCSLFFLRSYNIIKKTLLTISFVRKGRKEQSRRKQLRY